MTMSTILRVFLDSMDEPPGPREETYLIEAWARMSDADKRLAEDAVIERIRQTGAPRAIMSAVEMNLPRAIVDITKWQQSADLQIKNTAERALRFLTPDGRVP